MRKSELARKLLSCLCVDQDAVALQIGSQILGRQNVNDEDFVVAGRQLSQGALGTLGVEQVGDQHGQSGPSLARHHGKCRLGHGPATGVKGAQGGEQFCRMPSASPGRSKWGEAVREARHEDPIGSSKGNPSQRFGHFGGVIQLGALHAGGGIDEHLDDAIGFFLEELDPQRIESPGKMPVEVPKIVSMDIGTVVRELLALTSASGASLASRHTGPPFANTQSEAGQTVP